MRRLHAAGDGDETDGGLEMVGGASSRHSSSGGGIGAAASSLTALGLGDAESEAASAARQADRVTMAAPATVKRRSGGAAAGGKSSVRAVNVSARHSGIGNFSGAAGSSRKMSIGGVKSAELL